MFNLGATELTMICGMCSVLVILPIVIALAYPRKRKKWSANSVKNTPR